MTDPAVVAPFFHFHPEEGEHCCFPSSAETAYARIIGNRWGEDRSPRQLLSGTPCYVERTDETVAIPERVRFWLWYNFNAFPGAPFGIGEHLGDWESIVVYLRAGKPVVWALSNHTTARVLEPRYAFTVSDRVRVWVAKGSHAHYEASAPASPGPPGPLKDRVRDGGPTLDAAPTLLDVSQTSFGRAHFSGDWGGDRGIYGPPRRSIEQYDKLTRHLW